MLEQHIVISKTARDYTSCAVSVNIKTVWFVCHGYAQLAGEFIKEFESFASPEALIVAPEGLSRFYTKGFFGTVGATWMTKEDRLYEIRDYVNYLNTLCLQIKTGCHPHARMNILGFSQGCSTVCRWITQESPDFSALFLCSGSVPDDLDFKKFRAAIDKRPAYYLTGDADPFISEKDIQAFEQRNKEHQLPLQIHRFNGGHSLNLKLLKSLGK